MINMIKTIIIEDEKPAARKLARMISLIPGLELLTTLESVEEALAWFENNDAPQLIFSDIMLGDGTSFDIFEKHPINSFIIFTTAYDQYTLNAFKLNSIDYLLKPILQEDLVHAVEKYKAFLPNQKLSNDLDFKDLIKKQEPKLSRILVKIGYNLKIISTSEISCFYSENKIAYLQTKERNFPTDFTLEELDQNLDDTQFFRVNRQVIINLKYIKNIHTSPFYKVDLEFQPEMEITVSRDRVKEFKDWLVK